MWKQHQYYRKSTELENRLFLAFVKMAQTFLISTDFVRSFAWFSLPKF